MDLQLQSYCDFGVRFWTLDLKEALGEVAIILTSSNNGGWYFHYRINGNGQRRESYWFSVEKGVMIDATSKEIKLFWRGRKGCRSAMATSQSCELSASWPRLTGRRNPLTYCKIEQNIARIVWRFSWFQVEFGNIGYCAWFIVLFSLEVVLWKQGWCNCQLAAIYVTIFSYSKRGMQWHCLESIRTLVILPWAMGPCWRAWRYKSIKLGGKQHQ